MKNGSFVTIQWWMVDVLGLKGNELLTYALVLGFSQDGESWFSGSASYVSDWCGSSRKATGLNTLKSLVGKGFLEKRDRTVSGIRVCEYRAIVPDCIKIASNENVENSEDGMSQSVPGVRKAYQGGYGKRTRGGTESVPNNIEDIYRGKDREGRHSVPPTPANVEKYASEQSLTIDANRFCDYYAAQGWRLKNGNPMKDWQAAVRNWCRRDGQGAEQATETRHIPTDSEMQAASDAYVRAHPELFGGER